MNIFNFITDIDISRVWGRVFSVISLFLASSILSLVQAATNCSAVTEMPQSECETLMALYNSTNGPNWTDSPANNWNITNTPCSWTEVTSGNGHVTEISRNNKNLVGTLPDLSALVNLTVIELIQNQLSGSIPDLSALVNLTLIGLRQNQLGAVPFLPCRS
jgi:Leucine-rich repeat (LRR) protein